MILSLDPGVHVAGFALWHNYRLFQAGLLRDEEKITNQELTEIVVELPQVYRRGKGDSNDLIALAFAAGLIVGELRGYAKIIKYSPATWKGQVPKTIMIERIKQGLSDKEHDRVNLPTAKSLAHNVWDAVGIGLYHLRGVRR